MALKIGSCAGASRTRASRSKDFPIGRGAPPPHGRELRHHLLLAPKASGVVAAAVGASADRHRAPHLALAVPGARHSAMESLGPAVSAAEAGGRWAGARVALVDPPLLRKRL